MCGAPLTLLLIDPVLYRESTVNRHRQTDTERSGSEQPEIQWAIKERHRESVLSQVETSVLWLGGSGEAVS